MMKLLVTGGTGLVGSNVIRLARADGRYELVASIFSQQPAAAWGCPTVTMDLEDNDSITRAVVQQRPEVVIHCAAPRDEDRLERDHAWGWQVMVAGTESLARACREVGAKLVFVSSDWVFGNGGDPPYAESSPPCPVNYFGFLKVIGETWVASLCPDYAVVRIAGVYGPNYSFPAFESTEAGLGFGWLANHFYYRLSRNLPVAVAEHDVNVWANPSLASDVAGALLAVAGQSERGIFHCCGRDSVSRLQLARAVAEVFGFDPGLVRPALPAGKAGSPAGRLIPPYDSRLSWTETENRLGHKMLGLYDGLAEYRRQLAQLAAQGAQG